MPDLMVENQDVWNVLSIGCSQWRDNALDYSVIIEIAKAMSIEISTVFFKKLKAYEETVSKMRGKR